MTSERNRAADKSKTEEDARVTTSVCGALLDIFLPHLCALCNERTVEDIFCAECKAGFEQERLAGPCCTVCSEPFISQEAVEHACGVCVKSPPPFVQAKGLYLYRGAVLDALHKLKYRGDITMARPLGRILSNSINKMKVRFDTIIPVPLYKSRLQKRSFNQSLLMAKEASKRLYIPLDYRGLKRVRDTGAQVGLGRTERAKNISGAFKAVEPELYKNKTVLLIDDVYTTGATMRECAGVIKAAGAVPYAITVARAAKF